MKTAIDLFAGAGGLSTGLEMAGFEVLFANEVSDTFSTSLKYNHPRTIVETADIRDLEPKTVRKLLSLEKGDLDLLAGGPPCQGFSINAPKRSTEDHRNHLFLDYLRFVDEFEPKIVLIENVPGMVSFEKGQTIQSILQSLENLGYKAEVRILYAAHYGVPQMRWRTIFLASKLDVDVQSLFPKPIYNTKGRPNFATSLKGESLLTPQHLFEESQAGHVTIEQAIGDLPPIPNKGGFEVLDYTSPPTSEYQKILRSPEGHTFNHICAGLGRANLERLPHIPQGGSWRDIPFDLLPKGMQRAKRSDHTQRYGRLSNCGIGSTILTKCDPHWGRYIHPEQDRVLSVREAARIQSFPDNCRFFGKLADQYMQVGNAVPPLFAKAIGETVYKVLDTPQIKRDDSNSEHSLQLQLEI
ncbi:TPA: DNA cytosine methyltransferase [Vibrio parahaemolyticus]